MTAALSESRATPELIHMYGRAYSCFADRTATSQESLTSSCYRTLPLQCSSAALQRQGEVGKGQLHTFETTLLRLLEGPSPDICVMLHWPALQGVGVPLVLRPLQHR